MAGANVGSSVLLDYDRVVVSHNCISTGSNVMAFNKYFILSLSYNTINISATVVPVSHDKTITPLDTIVYNIYTFIMKKR